SFIAICRRNGALNGPSRGSNRYSQRILRLNSNLSVIQLPSSGRKGHPPLEAIISKLVLFARKRRPFEAINAVSENKLALPLGVESNPCRGPQKGEVIVGPTSVPRQLL